MVETANKKPPWANQDLWMALVEARSRHDITWKRVKKHSSDDGNEEADALANKGIDELCGEIVLDSETTGLSTAQGHRIIGNQFSRDGQPPPDGWRYHPFLNPDREIEGPRSCPWHHTPSG